MSSELGTARQAASLNEIAAALNSGTLKLYNGTRPATPQTAVTTQTLLATVSLPATFAATTATAVLTANAISAAYSVAAGTATWGRFATSGGTAVIDADVVSNGDGLVISPNPIPYPGVVTVSSGTLTHS